MGILIGLVVLVFGVLTLWGIKDGIRDAKNETVDPEAQHNLGYGYLQKGKIMLALEHFRRAAALGNANSAYNLGVLHEKGIGVSKSDREAFAWFKRAAEGGVANAQYNLSVMFFNGRGVKESDHSMAESYKWILKAAEQGHDLARNSASIYDRSNDPGWDGDGLVTPDQLDDMCACVRLYCRNEARAVQRSQSGAGLSHYVSLMERAVAYRDSDAAVTLSLFYREGKEVPRDLGKAYAWMKCAADMGNSLAQLSLQLVSPSREPSPGDLDEAFALHKRAENDRSARFEIAKRFLEGRGVDRNYSHAAHWLWCSEDPANPEWRPAVLSVPEDHWPDELKSVRAKCLA